MISIAGLPIYWQEDRLDFVKEFVEEKENEPVIKINFSDNFLSSHSVQYTDETVAHFLKTASGDILVADKDWSNVTSYCLPKENKDYTLPLAALCSRLSYYDTLLAHSSFISLHGKGVLFTGYSGVGKTTQAELWAKHLGAEIVNGDKTFIREVDGKFFAYGSPWKGSSEYCLNKKALLSGIVVLRQAETNSITKLDKKAIELFMPHIFFPHWDKDCLVKALDTFDKLISSVPVWLLECRPDEDAVRITQEAVLGELWRN